MFDHIVRLISECKHFRDDEEDDIHAYPVVKEQAGRLLDKGINTLQKTLLLKKEVNWRNMNEMK